jgi:hypothetical protein
MPDAHTRTNGSAIPDPWTLPLETLDVSKGELFQSNRHGEYFLRLVDPTRVHRSEFQ